MRDRPNHRHRGRRAARPRSRTAAESVGDPIDRIEVERPEDLDRLGDVARGEPVTRCSAPSSLRSRRRPGRRRTCSSPSLCRWHGSRSVESRRARAASQRSRGIEVPLVVVHLLGRAQSEPERRELERALPLPGRDVQEHDAAGCGHASQARGAPSPGPRGARAPRDTASRRTTRLGIVGKHLREGTFDRRHLRMCASGRRRNRDVDEQRAADDVELCASEARVEAAAEVSRRAAPSNRAPRRTATLLSHTAEPVDRGRAGGAGRTRSNDRRPQRSTSVPVGHDRLDASGSFEAVGRPHVVASIVPCSSSVNTKSCAPVIAAARPVTARWFWRLSARSRARSLVA